MQNIPHTSQLKGWAIDRAIEIAKIQGAQTGLSVDSVLSDAQKMVDFAVVPVEIENALMQDILNKLDDAQYNREMFEAIALEPAKPEESA